MPQWTKPFRKGFRLSNSATDPLPTLGGIAEWSYVSQVDHNTTLRVTIEVHQGGGQEQALESMKRVGRSASMTPNPFGPTPRSIQLGDYSAMLFPERGGPARDVFWVYYNTFARVRVMSTTVVTFDVMPVARAIQSFMEEHVSTDVPKYLPARLLLPSKPLHVGDVVSVKLATTAEADTATPFILPFYDKGNLLTRRATRDSKTAEFEAAGAGDAIVGVVVFDKHTLQAQRLEGKIEILHSPQR